MKRFAALLLAGLLLAAPVARAEAWSHLAVYALPYLFHDEEVKNELNLLSPLFEKAALTQLEDSYIRELTRQNIVIQQEVVGTPICIDDLRNRTNGVYLKNEDVRILQIVSKTYGDIRKEFLDGVEVARDDLINRLNERERNAYKLTFSSDEMVELKDYYMKQPKFFTLPLTFANFTRFSKSIEPEQKHDIKERWPLVEQMADAFRLQQTSYDVQDATLYQPSPEIVQQNFAAYLNNEFTTADLSHMLAFTQSEAGTKYLRMKDKAFNNRVLLLKDMYRYQLANITTKLPGYIRMSRIIVIDAAPAPHRKKAKDDK
jgi:hypothetical protein